MGVNWTSWLGWLEVNGFQQNPGGRSNQIFLRGFLLLSFSPSFSFFSFPTTAVSQEGLIRLAAFLFLTLGTHCMDPGLLERESY